VAQAISISPLVPWWRSGARECGDDGGSGAGTGWAEVFTRLVLLLVVMMMMMMRMRVIWTAC
jgi:hypothetical protein